MDAIGGCLARDVASLPLEAMLADLGEVASEIHAVIALTLE